MKKKIIAMLCAGMCVVGMTACGEEESGSKNGYSTPEKAFEAFSEAMIEWDADKMLTLIPEEYIKRVMEIEDYDTNDELRNQMQRVIENTWECGKGNGRIILEKVEYKDKEYVEYAGDTMEWNEERLGMKIEYEDYCNVYCDEEGIDYWVIGGDDSYIGFYKHDGKWYSCDALDYAL